jgi:hypothetical protein
MHYHLEIVLPPTDNLETAISEVMKGFSENNEANYNAFWDWYVIGGRWSGCKLRAMLGEDKITKFCEKLNEMGITVLGLVCGKEEISPSSQIPLVDKLWNAWFPDSGIKICPLFKHSNKDSKILPGDIMDFKDVPNNLTMERIMFVSTEGKVSRMYQGDFHNGVNWIESDWNREFDTAVQKLIKDTKNYNPDYIKKIIPQPDWQVVTIDYHT